MDIEKIETIAHAEMASRQDNRFRERGWILYHGMRTGKIAVHLARTLDISVDPDILYVSGLFHDIGKGQDSHNTVGAERSRELLTDLIPKGTLDVICEAVNSHSLRKKADDYPDSVKLIQDADLIDHCGLIEVWMAFYWNGSNGESIKEQLAWFEGDENKQNREFMRTHLNYEVSRDMLDDRIQVSDRLFSNFHRVYFEGV